MAKNTLEDYFFPHIVQTDYNAPLPIRATPIDIPMNFDLVQIDAFMYTCFSGLSK